MPISSQVLPVINKVYYAAYHNLFLEKAGTKKESSTVKGVIYYSLICVVCKKVTLNK